MSVVLLGQTLDAIASLIERGDFAGAERRAQQALQTVVPHAEIWRLLAIAQLKSGKLDAAMRALQQARTLDPRSVEVLCNLAAVETMTGNAEGARRALEQALALAPDHVLALSSLGRLRYQLGDYDGAVQCFERSVRAQPGAAEPWLDLANTRIAQHRWQQAEDHLRYALSLKPRSPEGWYLLGYLFERQGRLGDALHPYRQSMELSARPHTAHNLALVLDQLGDWLPAARTLERALQLDPDLFEALSQLVYIKRRLCEWDDLPALAARLLAGVDAHRQGILPFSLLVEETTPAQQLACARGFARQFATTATAPPISMQENAPLRVGFVSSGFAQHATGLLVVELIEHLRASNLITIAFATTPDDRTDIHRRLEAGFHEFHDIAGRVPEEIANRIRAARIDILLDIDGYCMGSIPRIFALRPAPIQVNYLAYPGSMGAPWYDYLIADRYLIPAAQRAFYDEKIACLPGCYQPTDTTRAVLDPPPREACGLPARTSSNQGFVYCCFNATWKFTPQSFALWMRILAAVPDSVLWLLDGPPDAGVAQRLRDAAQRAGIDPQRLVFTGKLKHPDYLARFRHADLFLDTNPYNAHTTASDALYAGCPVLTRPGATFASRVAGSLNHQLGLDELNVDDDEAYVARAIELATQPQRLAALRAKLTEPERRARLFDMRAYARDFALLLTQMVGHKRRGDAPQDFTLVASLLPPGEGAEGG
jgi:predicted O-linked N-acetylglucosamine transferase (SPINDLY family)